MQQVAKEKNIKTFINFKKSEVEQIFNLVRDEKKQVRIAIGNTLVSTKKFKTFKEADKYLASKPWEIIINLTYYILQNETSKKAQEMATSAKEKSSESN